MPCQPRTREQASPARNARPHWQSSTNGAAFPALTCFVLIAKTAKNNAARAYASCLDLVRPVLAGHGSHITLRAGGVDRAASRHQTGGSPFSRDVSRTAAGQRQDSLSLPCNSCSSRRRLYRCNLPRTAQAKLSNASAATALVLSVVRYPLAAPLTRFALAPFALEVAIRGSPRIPRLRDVDRHPIWHLERQV
jgi:hypothetical protein